MLWVAAATAKAGWHVAILDSMALPGSGRYELKEGWLLGVPLDSFIEHLPDEVYDLVVLCSSPFLHPWEPHEDLRKLVSSLRALYRSSTLVLADCHVGGMHYVAYEASRVFSALPEIDVIVMFSGEHAFGAPDLLRGLRRQVIKDPCRPWKVPPPFPMYELNDWKSFGLFLHRVFGDGRWVNTFRVDVGTRPFVTSSGCPYRCIFCTSNPGLSRKGPKPYRVVPLEVVTQWAYLVRQITKASKLFILDEMANLRQDFEALLKVFEKLDLAYEFPNGLRADRLSTEAIAILAGRVSVLSLSAESGNEEDIFGPIGKRQPIREVERVVAEAYRRGLKTLVHFIVGFPWETPQHVQKTLDLAWRLWEAYGAEPSVQFATPVPGSALYEMCLDRGLLGPQSLRWPDPGLFQHRSAFRPPGLPEHYLEQTVRAFRTKVEASKIRKLIVNLTYQCINRCLFCAVANRVKRDVPLERVLEILREHRQKGVDLLDLDGGEPTLHPGLFDVISEARALGYRRVTVTTNGRRLKVWQFAKRLLQSGITDLLVSIHGSRAEIHEAATRVSGSFEESLRGLKNALRFRGKDVSIGVNTTLFSENIEDLFELGRLLASLQPEVWNIQFLTPFGAVSSEIVPDQKHAAQAVSRVIEAFSSTLRIQVVNAQFCLFEEHFWPYLVADTQKIGRTMVFVTEEEVNLFKYIAARRRKLAQCTECPHAPVCEGLYDFKRWEDGIEERRL